jgi:hypothetical protein
LALFRGRSLTLCRGMGLSAGQLRSSEGPVKGSPTQSNQSNRSLVENQNKPPKTEKHALQEANALQSNTHIQRKS